MQPMAALDLGIGRPLRPVMYCANVFRRDVAAADDGDDRPGGGSGWPRPASTAAVVAAPLGSTTRRACRNSQATASAICASETVTNSSTNACACANVMSPGRTGIRPSAIVADRIERHRVAGLDRAFHLGAPSGSTATTRTDGSASFTAAATPASSPPPPTGT